MARLFFVILGCVLAAQCITALEQPNASQETEQRGLYTVAESDEEVPFGDLTDVRDVVAAIKIQVKSIIEEVLYHIFDYSKGTFKHLKVKLLKKLAKWTLSDVFHAVFDGVANLVIEAEQVQIENTKETVKNHEEYHSQHVYKPVPARPHNFYHSLGFKSNLY